MKVNYIVQILELHTSIRKYFNDNKLKLEEYKLKLQELSLIDKEIFTFKDQTSLNNHIEELQRTIKDINYNESFTFYIIETMNIIDKCNSILKAPIEVDFFSNKPVKKNKKNEDEFKFIFDSFIKIITKYIPGDFIQNLITSINTKFSNGQVVKSCKKGDDVIPVNNSNELICENCSKKQFEVYDDRFYICIECGFEREFVPTTFSYKDIGRLNITSKYTYMRKIHFRDCIHQYQAKQNTFIPSEVYSKIIAKCTEYNLVDSDETLPKKIRFKKVTKEHIYMFLKETENCKHYEDIMLIYCNITGKKPPNISHLEEKLYKDFDALSDLYDKIPKDDRDSFLNSQYILYHILKRHKHPCKEEDFSELKTRERLDWHDNMYQMMVKELQWTSCL